jgi:hypothetical protein
VSDERLNMILPSMGAARYVQWRRVLSAHFISFWAFP